MIKQPLLIKGDIMHYRFFPKKNHFDYKSTYISFPISKLKELRKPLFSLSKFNLYGFYQSDYGTKDSANIEQWIKQILHSNNIDNINHIVLVTHPRVLGYVFNPVSFWLCFDEQKRLIAVLSEVNNTCGQKHCYLCFKEDLSEIKADDWLEAKKEFYVSPFMEIEGKYKFRFQFKDNQMQFFINYLVDDKLKLSTSLKCNFTEFNSSNLLLAFVKMPFFTLKTIILIHYQALKLWFKSIKHYRCPKPLNINLTIGKDAQKNS